MPRNTKRVTTLSPHLQHATRAVHSGFCHTCAGGIPDLSGTNHTMAQHIPCNLCRREMCDGSDILSYQPETHTNLKESDEIGHSRVPLMLVVLCAERRVAYRCVVVGCCCQMVCGGPREGLECWKSEMVRRNFAGSVPREKGCGIKTIGQLRRIFLRGGRGPVTPPNRPTDRNQREKEDVGV